MSLGWDRAVAIGGGGVRLVVWGESCSDYIISRWITHRKWFCELENIISKVWQISVWDFTLWSFSQELATINNNIWIHLNDHILDFVVMWWVVIMWYDFRRKQNTKLNPLIVCKSQQNIDNKVLLMKITLNRKLFVNSCWSVVGTIFSVQLWIFVTLIAFQSFFFYSHNFQIAVYSVMNTSHKMWRMITKERKRMLS
jgi:hypothetical protein